jgi:anti-sigma factor RsiW
MSTSAHDHDRWADSLGAWLLGALPQDEADGFAAHLDACAVCREEAATLRVAVDALPASVAPRTPPPALKSRLMRIVEGEASLLEAAGPESDRAPRPEPRRRRALDWLSGLLPRPALALPLVLLLLTVGAGGALLGREAFDQDARTVTARVNPELSKSARASLEVADGRARLVSSKLPPPPAGHVYQVWLDRGGPAPEPTSALFSTRSDGSASVDVPGPLDGVRNVMVTDEPAGGSDKPTGRIILSASPA